MLIIVTMLLTIYSQNSMFSGVDNTVGNDSILLSSAGGGPGSSKLASNREIMLSIP